MTEPVSTSPVVLESNGYQLPTDSQKNYMYITYAMYALGIFIGLTPIVGVILAYIKRDEMQGTVYYDHMQFLIKTFWVSLIGMVIGVILMLVLVGYLVLLAVGVWYIFRVVLGIVKLLDNKPVTPDGWFM